METHAIAVTICGIVTGIVTSPFISEPVYAASIDPSVFSSLKTTALADGAVSVLVQLQRSTLQQLRSERIMLQTQAAVKTRILTESWDEKRYALAAQRLESDS